jgi:glycosyltransferase involved in cell wall biosynthesis
MRRLLVISHPAAVSINQLVYQELANRGMEVTIVVPSHWRHEYAQEAFAPVALSGLEGRLVRLPVALAGEPQRHFHLARPGPVIAHAKPDVAFVEAEPYSLVASQWSQSLSSRSIPFGVQLAENIDRPLPRVVRTMRRAVLRRAAFVAARSETAARLARSWGALGRVAFAPHAVPLWQVQSARSGSRPFTVGYAGRLAPEKGLGDLVAAVCRLRAPVELLLAGNGELREVLDGQPIPGSRVRVLTGLSHDQMAGAYGRMDVLALPSRSTPRWKEQFGRAIVEALWCGVPVVGSDSGEIPWLIELTGGGLTFPEGDIDALSVRLDQMRYDPGLRARLAATGRSAVERFFAVPAATDALQDLLQTASTGRLVTR